MVYFTSFYPNSNNSVAVIGNILDTTLLHLSRKRSWQVVTKLMVLFQKMSSEALEFSMVLGVETTYNVGPPFDS